MTRCVIAALVTALSLSAQSVLSPVAVQDKPPTAYRLAVDYSPLIAALKARLPAQMAESNVPGLAIALVDGGMLIWAEGFGHIDRSNRTAATADTLFSLQSISKTYTATGLLIAADKGLLALDDPVRKYVPDFIVKSRFGADAVARITIRHLLSHRSGLIHASPCEYRARACTFRDHIQSLSDTWLKFPPGERFAYSNLGVDLAGHILELRARQSFDRFMRDELFKPLGMSSSTFNQEEAAHHASLARGHTPTTTLPVTPILIIPSGGLFSTANDTARFISFHLSGGRVAGQPLLREGLLNDMYAPQFPIDGQLGGYGLGVVSDPWRRGRLLYNNGRGVGYAASLSWIPEYQVGAVVLTNSVSGDQLAVGTAQGALQAMVEAKHARRGPARFTDKPIIRLDRSLLQLLEGTYKPDRSRLVAFKAKDDGLYFVSGGSEVKLNAHGPVEFTGGDRKYTFSVDAAGVLRGVHVLSYSGAEFIPLNDRPQDEPGPNKPGWRSFVGKYSEDDGNTTTVTIRNGHLYIAWDGDLKLSEYQPGLFETADGEVVSFQENTLYLRAIRPFRKVEPGLP